ncbi:amidohydrolase family protein [Maricaulis salignorans]|uniref:Amidohydrolase family protein n=1 Tax=Maricaulis salignorans TaxID=144026 RepID=A0A1G9LGT4_9PROT|nr:amidohydrolase family protein [Maricaulis salignorans]SDL61108.1 Amidohydrolase family protein [Maricaulis salignorans]
MNYRTGLLSGALALCVTAGAWSEGRQALVGGTLIDGYGGPPIHDSVILVEDDRIVATGNQDNTPVPDGYAVISTEGMTVMPGLWEMHAHLMLNGHSDYDHWDRTYLDRLEDEIMPASAVQLLLAGVTSVRDLGAPLEPSISVRDRINAGELPGPNLYVSGPFIQHEPYPGTEAFRWGVSSVGEARAHVRTLADAGVDVIKLVNQDQMTTAEARAVVDEAHARGLRVVGHSHRPEEIMLGLEIGIDNFEHTGLTTAPEYPPHVIEALRARTARGRISGGPLYWTPTIEGLWNYGRTRENSEFLDNDCWHRGLEPDTIADIAASIEHPERLSYTQLTPLRAPTLRRKFEQLREAGVVMLIGTDSGIPMKFHCQATWNEFDVWTRELDVPVMDAIRSATYWPAVFMGVADQTGSIAPGMTADIIAVDGDLMTYPNLLQHVDFVMKGGTVYVEDGQVNEGLLPANMRME